VAGAAAEWINRLRQRLQSCFSSGGLANNTPLCLSGSGSGQVFGRLSAPLASSLHPSRRPIFPVSAHTGPAPLSPAHDRRPSATTTACTITKTLTQSAASPRMPVPLATPPSSPLPRTCEFSEFSSPYLLSLHSTNYSASPPISIRNCRTLAVA
jgi:hypothetical protein